MIYNFNLGIGWASSGVEYAQAYRARALRNAGLEARFVFTVFWIPRFCGSIHFLQTAKLRR